MLTCISASYTAKNETQFQCVNKYSYTLEKMDWYTSIIFLHVLLINLISCRFIHFENGYEYSYQYVSDSTIEGVGNFKTDAKVSLDFLSFNSSLLLNAK